MIVSKVYVNFKTLVFLHSFVSLRFCFFQTASKITSDTISMIAEAYCFAAIGLSVHEFDASQWCWGFIVVMVLVLMIARCDTVLYQYTR